MTPPKLDNATTDQLEHWADAILEAPTLEAVLAEHFKKCRTLKKTVCQKSIRRQVDKEAAPLTRGRAIRRANIWYRTACTVIFREKHE